MSLSRGRVSDLGNRLMAAFSGFFRRSQPAPKRHDVRHVDVYMTACRRPEFLKRSLALLLEACRASPFGHRVIVMLDHADKEDWRVLEDHLHEIHVVSSCHNLGLPFFFNLMHDYQSVLEGRTETRADYLCYIQDDCEIRSPRHFFPLLVQSYEHFLKDGRRLGFSSGYYSPVHPGFEKVRFQGHTMVLSDSISGPNIFGPAEVFREVGKMAWTLPTGERRGNPGPSSGSHFDLWQWRESPHATLKTGRVNLIVPGLVSSMASRREESTWGSPGDEPEFIADRVRQGRIYKTRLGPVPELTGSDFFRESPDDRQTS